MENSEKNEYMKLWRRENKEKISANRKQIYEQKKEEILRRQRELRKKKKEMGIAQKPLTLRQKKIRNDKQKESRKLNPERAKAYARKWYNDHKGDISLKNKENGCEKQKRWAAENIENVMMASKKFRESHKEQRIMEAKIYRIKNKGKIKEYTKRYRENSNKEEAKAKRREYYLKQKEKNIGVVKVITPEIKAYKRNLHLYRKFKMTHKDYEIMLLAQNNKCSCCSSEATDHIVFCVDHSHETGKVRGLLCRACNTSLGLIKENLDTLKKMIIYLKKHTK